MILSYNKTFEIEKVVILSGRMMGWLAYCGNKLIAIKEDLKDPSRDVYIFKNTEKLKEDMKRYSRDWDEK